MLASCAAVVAAAVLLITFINSVDSSVQQETARERALITQVRQAIEDYGWHEDDNSLKVHYDAIEGFVAFGSCTRTLAVKAPADNPRDVTITFPAEDRYKDAVSYKLRDTHFKDARAQRSGLGLSRCFIDTSNG